MAELSGRLGFTKKAGADVASEGELRREQLDGNDALQALVAGPVDDTHATASNLLINLIRGAERLFDMRSEFRVLCGRGYGIGHSQGNRGGSYRLFQCSTGEEMATARRTFRAANVGCGKSAATAQDWQPLRHAVGEKLQTLP